MNRHDDVRNSSVAMPHSTHYRRRHGIEGCCVARVEDTEVNQQTIAGDVVAQGRRGRYPANAWLAARCPTTGAESPGVPCTRALRMYFGGGVRGNARCICLPGRSAARQEPRAPRLLRLSPPLRDWATLTRSFRFPVFPTGFASRGLRRPECWDPLLGVDVFADSPATAF